jgi:hypothetical protein
MRTVNKRAEGYQFPNDSATVTIKYTGKVAANGHVFDKEFESKGAR